MPHNCLTKLPPVVHTIRRAHTRFPALCVSYMHSLQFLIGSLDYLCPLWLARVITLVLIFWHSLKTASKSQPKDIYTYLYFHWYRWSEQCCKICRIIFDSAWNSCTANDVVFQQHFLLICRNLHTTTLNTAMKTPISIIPRRKIWLVAIRYFMLTSVNNELTMS